MKSNKVVGAIAVVVIIAAALLFWRQSAGPRVNLQPSSAVGEVVVDELSRLLNGPGKVLIITRQIPGDGPNAAREQVASLTAALEHHASLKLAATEWMPRLSAGMMDMGAITPEQLQEALQKHPDANAAVVVAGLPAFSQPLMGQLAARSLKLASISGLSSNLRRWLEAKALAFAVVPRASDTPDAASSPKTARDWFQREFEIVTPETVGQVGR